MTDKKIIGGTENVPGVPKIVKNDKKVKKKDGSQQELGRAHQMVQRGHKIAASRGHPRLTLCHCCTENNGQTVRSVKLTILLMRDLHQGQAKHLRCYHLAGHPKSSPATKNFQLKSYFGVKGRQQGALIHNVTPMEFSKPILPMTQYHI